MYVCICADVRESDVRELMKEGLTTMKEVCIVSQAGMDCGNCVKKLRDMLLTEPAKPAKL